MNKSESIANLAAALAKAQAEMKNPSFDSNNPFFKSKYASLAAVRNAVIPVLAANGLSVVQEVTHSEGASSCSTTLMHASGQWLTQEPFRVPVAKGDAQGACAAATYARRASLQALACVVGDADDDGETAVGRGEAPAAGAFQPKYQKAHKDPVGEKPEEVPAASAVPPSAQAYLNYLGACSTLSQVEGTAKSIAGDAKHFTDTEIAKLRDACREAKERVSPSKGVLRTVLGRTQAEWTAMKDPQRELNGEITQTSIDQLTAYGRAHGVSTTERLLGWLADTHHALPTSKHGDLRELWQVGGAWFVALKAKIDARAGAAT